MATSQTSSPSPWGKTQTVVPCSLEDVMSEQLASQLQEDNNHITVFGYVFVYFPFIKKKILDNHQLRQDRYGKGYIYIDFPN